MLMLVDNDMEGARTIQHILKRRMPDVQVHVVNNGLQALELGHSYGTHMRLVALEVQLPFLDGRFLAAALRRLALSTVIIPFTSARDALPFFAELGCAEPLIKPCSPESVAERLISTYHTAATPAPEAAWLSAMCAQAEIIKSTALPKDWRWPVLASQEAERERIQKARALLQRYADRTGSHMRGRELAQSMKLLDQCLSA